MHPIHTATNPHCSQFILTATNPQYIQPTLQPFQIPNNLCNQPTVQLIHTAAHLHCNKSTLQPIHICTKSTLQPIIPQQKPKLQQIHPETIPHLIQTKLHPNHTATKLNYNQPTFLHITQKPIHTSSKLLTLPPTLFS